MNKLYCRQIRPVHFSPGCQGFSDTRIPLDDWFHEEMEESLRKKYEKHVTEIDPWGELIFEERYVEVSATPIPWESEEKDDDIRHW